MDLKQQRIDAKLASEREAERRPAPLMKLASMSKNDLIREVRKLNAIVDRFDMAAMVNSALEKRQRMRDVPKFQHEDAFMLLVYVSEGGTEEAKVWNSRDGVVPGAFYQKGLTKMVLRPERSTGPFLDRPGDADAQWETRTVKAMMEAWDRALTRGMVAGAITQVQKVALAGDVEAAKKRAMYVGLRDLNTGRYTDEQS